METAKKQKKENGFKRFLKAVFVHNFAAKITAVIISALLWVLAVGLSAPKDTSTQPAQDSAVIERSAEK